MHEHNDGFRHGKNPRNWNNEGYWSTKHHYSDDFLTEATLIGMLGGLIGVPTGYGLSYLLSFVASNFMGGQRQDTVFQAPETQSAMVSPIFSLWWAAGAIVFGITVCVLFGLYPARKAAKLDPVKALRYE